jgi:hypothetical protein
MTHGALDRQYLIYLLNGSLSFEHLTEAGFVPGDPISFVFHLSDKLAEFAPQLTVDFVHEVSAAMTGMDRSAMAQRISCLQYMSPWIPFRECNESTL